MKIFSQEYLKECFDYNEITGDLVRRPRPLHHFKTKRAYAVALSKSMRAVNTISTEGYVKVFLDGKSLYAHRIIWIIKTGNQPCVIDHIDHDRSNNSWINLRNVTCDGSSKNLGLRSDNTSGITGVYFNKHLKKWAAQCSINGKIKYIGIYSDIHDASQAVLLFRRNNDFHDNHGLKHREARGRIG